MATIFGAFITSVMTSLLVWRFYVNWQYHQSTAGTRLAKVIAATQRVLDFHKGEDEHFINIEMSTTYRNSLGLVLYALRLNEIKKNALEKNELPLTQEQDLWAIYDQSVRPVITDINNNSFIGWLPGIPNIHRLLAAQRLCFAVEEYIAALEKARKLNVPLTQTKKEYEKLRDCWQHWTQLIKQMKVT